MAKYILLSKLTENGRQTLKTKPERIKEVNVELEALGVKVIKQYAVLGPYDFVNIVEAPDNEAEDAEEEILDQATAARTIAELKAEIGTLKRLEGLAQTVRQVAGATIYQTLRHRCPNRLRSSRHTDDSPALTAERPG